MEILDGIEEELHHTSSASQANSRCDLWRISPWSGPPVRRSNASSLPRSAAASVSVMTRIGKTQPSSRYCSIWSGERHFGIDPHNSSGQGRTGSLPLPGHNDYGQPFPRLRGRLRQNPNGRQCRAVHTLVDVDERSGDRLKNFPTERSEFFILAPAQPAKNPCLKWRRLSSNGGPVPGKTA